jgi:hypothetical protein
MILGTGNALAAAARSMPMPDRVAEIDLIVLPHSENAGAIIHHSRQLVHALIVF